MEFLSTANLFIIMIKSRRISFYLYVEYKFLFHYDNRLNFHRKYLSKIYFFYEFCSITPNEIYRIVHQLVGFINDGELN